MGFLVQGGAPPDDSVSTAKIKSDAVTSAKIADDAIDSEHYTDGSIDTAHIAANAIDETKLKDALVADFTEVTVVAGDSILLGDASDSGNTKRDTVQGILDLAGGGKLGQMVYGTNTTQRTITALIPFDSTIPQNTEGVEIITQAITPANASSNLIVTFVSPYTHGQDSDEWVGGLFKDSGANAINAFIGGSRMSSHRGNNTITLVHVEAAGSTSARTYKVRMGQRTTGTLYINRDASGGGNTLGNAPKVLMMIEEILP